MCKYVKKKEYSVYSFWRFDRFALVCIYVEKYRSVAMRCIVLQCSEGKMVKVADEIRGDSWSALNAEKITDTMES